ncbi:hypothetical protein TrCOL_g8144 [Triparma columacea]|uniref:Uncharacterized protein n=1 Tax=Triparma columacea TaxID=722753 RepID=A0A9W7L484_9STRA|nr:hypothetical protein TrCOL_g8144 [Triparma columacea]
MNAVKQEETDLIDIDVKVVEGDLLLSSASYIVHQTNCITKKSLGLSKAMFNKFPHSNVYNGSADPRVPGTIVIRGGSGGSRGVVNLFGQRRPGKPTGAESRATREGWFKSGLNALVEINGVTPLGSVAFPFEIGCGLARGTWANYERMINDFARQVDDVEVTIVRLPRAPTPSLIFPTSSMLVHVIEGDLLESSAKYIVHQTNCTIKKSSGLSPSLCRAMFSKFPYSNVYDGSADPRVPGTIVIRGGSNGERGVVNLFGQHRPGKPTGAESRATREGWFKSGLNALVEINGVTPLGSVAFPHEIGCGLARGTWGNYERMINDFARQVDDVEVTIVRLPRAMKKKTKTVKKKTIKAASKTKAKAKPAMVKVKKEVG